jgi:dTDP-4-dehydrorhamnose reductase
MGINYYITSERFLDERLDRYPPVVHGGNGRHRYADVEAVRVRAEGVAGFGVALAEAWARYGLPQAITEAHLGGTREEQMRWLWEAWRTAREQRGRGVDLRAVTVWSLLGCYDWDSLVTRRAGHYEPGAYDLRAPAPRPTALARLAADLGAGREPAHPALATPGWWRRPARLLYPPAPPEVDGAAPGGHPAPPLLILGATGTLGRAFARVCRERGLAYRLLGRRDLDITDPAAVAAALARWRPWAVVNAAGYTRLDDAEREPDRCSRANTEGPAILASACAAGGAALLTLSSDLVFDGRQDRPYLESDAPAPLSVYGRSKAEAERRVLEALPAALVIRAGAVFGPWDAHNFAAVQLRELAAGRSVVAADDAVVSPTYAPDLVHTCLDLLIDGERGVWHLANPGAVTWAAFARQAAELAGFNPRRVQGRPTAALGLAAPRPRYSALGSERGVLLPPLESALRRYVQERPAAGPVAVPVPVAPAVHDPVPSPVGSK